MAAITPLSITAVFAALILTTSCTTHKPAPPHTATATAPAVEERTYRWIRNPAVDLMSPEGTIIRAATESHDLAGQSDKHGRAAYQDSYPGFAQAFRSPRIDGLYSDGGADPGRQTLRGTTYYEVIALTNNGDTYTANICEYHSGTSARSGTGYRNGAGDSLGNSLSVTFGPDPALKPDEQRPTLANQKGPAQRPTANVFGTWIVTDVSGLGGKFPECNKLAPGTTPDQAAPYYVWPEPPPVLPPNPGWPEGNTA